MTSEIMANTQPTDLYYLYIKVHSFIILTIKAIVIASDGGEPMASGIHLQLMVVSKNN